ncbi:MAG: hypothetical protein ACXWWH_01745 [Nitrospira sp.]
MLMEHGGYEGRIEPEDLGGHMIVWWLLGGIVAIVIGVALYKERRLGRWSSSGSHSVMTKTTDGEPLQFLVRSTRKTGREFRP